jgi:hypothetical protein
MMTKSLRYLQKLALAFWIGEMLFFIVVFAPRVFKILPRDMAGKLQNSIFPGYFTVGIVCALVIIIAQFILSMDGSKPFAWLSERRRDPNTHPYRQLWILGLASISGGIFAYCLLSISPQLSELQPLMVSSPTPEVIANFQALHRQSVTLNGTALLGLLILLSLI